MKTRLSLLVLLLALVLPLPALAQSGGREFPGFAVGRYGNSTLYEVAQQMEVRRAAWWFGFDLEMADPVGSPVGTITWEVRRFNALTNRTGGLVAHGQFAPPDEAGVVTVDAFPALLPPGQYMVLWRSTTDQRSGDYWNALATPGDEDELPGVLMQRQADPRGEWGAWDGQDVLVTFVMMVVEG